jgi:hypothetical protein
MAANEGHRPALEEAAKQLEDARGLVAKAFLENETTACSTLVGRAFTQTQNAAKNLEKATRCLELPPVLQESFAESRAKREVPLPPQAEVPSYVLYGELPAWDASP